MIGPRVPRRENAVRRSKSIVPSSFCVEPPRVPQLPLSHRHCRRRVGPSTATASSPLHLGFMIFGSG